MNQFFYEQRGNEKVRELMKEGTQSQAVHRSGASGRGLLRGLPKIMPILLGILGLLALLLR